MARAFGFKVAEYFVGFGPKLWSFRRGEIEYGVKALPAGGLREDRGDEPVRGRPARGRAAQLRREADLATGARDLRGARLALRRRRDPASRSGSAFFGDPRTAPTSSSRCRGS